MKIIAIAGVTGIGKTSLALQLKQYHNVHIISIDSVQVYTHPAIFSNKPKNTATHSLINSCDFNEPYDVDIFKKQFELEIEYAKKTSKIPVLVGGTGLYFSKLNFNENETLKIFLTQNRKTLYRNLDRRCEEMIIEGGLDEVLKMKKDGFGFDCRAGKSIGCRDAISFFNKIKAEKTDQLLLFNDFMNCFRRRTRNYARKQECWFRKENFFWVDIARYDPFCVVEGFLSGKMPRETLKIIDKESRNTNLFAKKEMKTYVSEYQILTVEKNIEIINRIFNGLNNENC